VTAGPGLVLVTRPQGRVEATAECLRDLGHAPLLDPMLGLEEMPADIAAPDAQAILFTSAHAVALWVKRNGRRDLPAWAVGDRTGEAAREAGFASVEAGDGFAETLADRLMVEIDPAAGPLLWPSGEDIAVDLAASLGEVGITVDRRVLYRSLPSSDLKPETRAELAAGRIAAALFYSPKTARVFASHVARAGLADHLAGIRALCLSQAVADGLVGLPFRSLEVASEPSEEALLALLGEPQRQGQTEDVMHDPDSATPNTTPTLSAETVIDRFGGLRPMASRLGVAVSTIQGWKQRGHIPENRWAEVEAAARAHGIDLSAEAKPIAPLEGEVLPPEPETDAALADDKPVEVEADAGAKAPPDDTPPPESQPQPQPSKSAEANDKPEDGAKATSHPASAPVPARAPSGRAPAWAALALGLVALAGAVTRPVWAPHVDPLLPGYQPAPALQVQAPASDPALLAALEARLARLEQAPAQPVIDTGPLDSRIVGVEAALADLSARLDGVAARPATDIDPQMVAALKTAMDALRQEFDALRAETQAILPRLTGLDDRTAAVETGLGTATAGMATLRQDMQTSLTEMGKRLDRIADSGGRAAALALAIGDLDRAMESGTQPQDAVQQLRLLAGKDAEVADVLTRIEPLLAAPVPGIAELRRRFAAIAPDLQAPVVDTGTTGLVDDVLKNLMSVVSVRRVGDAAELPAAARAEAALADGDLAGAVAALDGMDEPAASWIAQARTRLSLDALRQELRRLSLARLGTVGEAQP